MILRQIESWEQFVTSAKKWTEKGPNGPNIFRGQSDESWSLMPSLTRRFEKKGYDHKKAHKVEGIILHEFQNRYRDIDDHCKTLKKTDALSWWEVMQHHSVPTRLLDWSKSPYASLYFAASGSPEKNGAFYIMDAGHLQWIQALRAKDPNDKPNSKAFQELNKAVNGNSYEKSMVVITAPFPTSRMNAQHSSFTISTEILEAHDITGDNITFDRCENHAETNLSIFDKFVVPSTLKSELLKKLDEESFTQETLFPDSRIMDKDSEEFLKIIEQIIEENP
jgi:hypothetical protein